MMGFINEILLGFRSSFRRKATFEWFIVVVLGLLVRTDHLGVTSVVRALSVDYISLLGFFRSGAWSLAELTATWCKLVKRYAPLLRQMNSIIIIGDGVKVSKEGRKMPAVKRQHQESDNSSKSEYIWGHLYGGIGVAVGNDDKCFCLPLALLLQDGVKNILAWNQTEERQGSHVVEIVRLAGTVAAHMGENAFLLLDRLFLTVPALQALEVCNRLLGIVLHIITKAKSNCVAYLEPEPPTGKPGRPRIKGAAVKLFDLFSSAADLFRTAALVLYGKLETVHYYSLDLLWGKKLYKKLRFVLVMYGDTKAILVSTDLELHPLDIIQLYSRRFTIEVMFREMKQVICAFGYRFWSRYMPKLNRFSKKTDPDPILGVDNITARNRIGLALKAIEGFVFCSAVAIGIMQMVSLRFSGTNELSNLRYMRTYRNTVASEATIADYFRKNIFSLLLLFPDLPINRIIVAKRMAFLETNGFHDIA
jgi:hypothetical protein